MIFDDCEFCPYYDPDFDMCFNPTAFCPDPDDQ